MNKNDLKLRLYSKSDKTISNIMEVVNTPTFSKLLFPASINQNPESLIQGQPEKILLKNAAEFQIAYIPHEFIEKEHITFFLNSDNGIKCEMRLQSHSNRFLSNVIVNFNPEHIFIQNVIDNEILIDAIMDNLNVFCIHKAEAVYSSYDSNEPRWRIKYSTYQSDIIYPQWITFIGQEICDYVGRKHLLSLDGCAEIREIGNGLLLVFQEEPFDPQNSAHLQHRDYILEQLNAIPLPSLKD